MLFANGDWLDGGFGEAGGAGEVLAGALLGGCKVGMIFVRVYVATWKTE
jgi:hypothetical protein